VVSQSFTGEPRIGNPSTRNNVLRLHSWLTIKEEGMDRRWHWKPYAAVALTVCAMALAGAAAVDPQAAGPGLNEPGGSGPFPAAATTTPELPGHTLYHPVQLPRQALPLYVWGNGGCSDNGLSHAGYLREIASRGYFVIALGAPRQFRPPAAAAGGASALPPARRTPAPASSQDPTQPAQMIEAIEWATRENARAGSPFQNRIDITRIAVGGHSCGGLQALAVSHDPRVRTTLVLASGIYIRPGGRSGVEIDKSQLGRLHAPLLYLTGGPEDIAHSNATDDVRRISNLPVFFGSLPVGHGGTFSQPDGGEWAHVSTRWLDWQLKGDADASWDFSGNPCRLCVDEDWTVVRKNLPPPRGPRRESLYVPARDNTLLAMNIYRPTRNGELTPGRLPTVFAFTPYRARFRDADGRVRELESFPHDLAQRLLDSGYVLAVADIRGKGASYGARRGFQDRTEAMDGHGLVQWLAAQPWSNGRVGMYGCSYLGGTTVHVATTAPPALRAIFTGATDLDKFAFVRNGGITAQFNTRPDEPLSDDLASVPVDEDWRGEKLREAVAQHAANTPMAPLWYGMPFRDSVSPLTGNRFWEEVGPYTYLDTLRSSGIATYFWSNLRDEPTGQMILAAENLGGRLLIGPGSHCAVPPEFDFAGEVQRHFDQHLRDIRAPASARVKWWLEEAPAGRNWREDQRWPGVDAPRQRWYLVAANAEGRLQQGRTGRTSAEFTVDYQLGTAEAFAFWAQSQHGRGLSFTSAALPAAQELVGFPVMRLRVASSDPEPLLFAYLEQIGPDGSVDVLAFGRLAAAYRKTGKAPYDTLGLPWITGLAADHAPLAPESEVELDFALTPVARVISAGSRLRVVITGADPRQRNLADIRKNPPPRIRVFSGRNGSWIELPLRPPT
jgi:putative CocE/NonD family hydrolase